MLTAVTALCSILYELLLAQTLSALLGNTVLRYERRHHRAQQDVATIGARVRAGQPKSGPTAGASLIPSALPSVRPTDTAVPSPAGAVAPRP